MRFIELQQAGMVGAQRVLINADAISWVQEVTPEQGSLWPSEGGPTRALVHLPGLLQPVPVLQSPDEIAALASGVGERRAAAPRARKTKGGRKARDGKPQGA